MLMKCWGDGWSAEIICSDEPSPDNLMHCQCQTLGITKDVALKAAELLLKVFTGGRKSAVRVWPEACTESDFDTKETNHHGYVRFSFLTTPDKQTDVSTQIAQLPFGVALNEVHHG